MRDHLWFLKQRGNLAFGDHLMHVLRETEQLRAMLIFKLNCMKQLPF